MVNSIILQVNQPTLSTLNTRGRRLRTGAFLFSSGELKRSTKFHPVDGVECRDQETEYLLREVSHESRWFVCSRRIRRGYDPDPRAEFRTKERLKLARTITARSKASSSRGTVRLKQRILLPSRGGGVLLG